MKFPPSPRVMGSVALIGVFALGMSSCAGTPDDSPASSSDPDAPIVVWTDSTRNEGVEAYAAENPDLTLDITVYSPAELLSKVQLFNASGEGWPDVAFGTASAADPYYDWAQELDDKLSDEVKGGFGSANRPCEFDGKTYCLVNDVSQEVLWYNSELLDEFGYTVPTTWEEYEDLGLRLADEHPGYVIGSAGSSFMYHNYFRASECALQNVTAPNVVEIDATGRACEKVAMMLDDLIAAGAVTTDDMFSPEFTALAQSGKVLMHPGASWFGEFVFRPEASWAFPAGVLAAAPYPAWEGAAEPSSANAGGGVYIVSKHARNMDGAIALAEWMATAPEYQSTAPTYPAYGPMLEEWSVRVSEDPYFAADPIPALEEAVTRINPLNESTVRYDVETAFANIVVPVVRAKGSITDALPALGEELANLAQTVGYQVAD